MAKRSNEIYLIVHSSKKILLPHLEEVSVGREIISSKNVHISRRHLLFIADLHKNVVSVSNVGHNPIKILKTDSGKMALYPGDNSLVDLRDSLELPGNNNLSFSGSGGPSLFQRFGRIDLTYNNSGPWIEFNVGGVLVYAEQNAAIGSLGPKVAAFDMDGTLIVTKSGRVFATDENDWQFLNPAVPTKLKQLVSDGFSIVIFSNQAGIGGGSTNKKSFKIKVEAIIAALGVPVQVWVSTRKDFFRKPQPGMFYCCLELNKLQLDYSKSFYVGDAAGRPAGWARGKKKDFSTADVQFASNVGLPFVTPEELFLGHQPVGVTPGWKPFSTEVNGGVPTVVPASETEVIVMVGSPASGKSFVASELKHHGYEIISRDELGSWQKCTTMLTFVLAQGKSAVIDCTNPDAISRSRYVNVASSRGVPARCVVMDVPVNHCRHNNAFRRLTDDNHEIIPDGVIYSYWKNFVPPELKEGFTEIIKVPFQPKFTDSELKALYNMYLTF